jgi:peptidyl-prolyl cis-trans isomerase A (cyclophilin A)
MKLTHSRFASLLALSATGALLCLLATGCSSKTEAPKEAAKEAAPPPAATPAPTPAEEKKDAVKPEAKKQEPAAKPADANTFKVKFTTTKGVFIVEVHRDWAPIGAERFEQLVKDGYYDNSGFFRVVPNFVIQFGLAADPKMTKKWDKKIKDDAVKRTNKLGYLVFATAGPNTRTTQLFINMRSNQFLDDQGFAPFAEVVDGMKVVESIYSGHGEKPDQGMIEKRGTPYLKENFPKLDFITKATVL